MDDNIYRKVFDEVIKVPEKDLFEIFFSCKEDMKKIEKDLIPRTRCTSMIKLVQYLLTAYICRNSEVSRNEQSDKGYPRMDVLYTLDLKERETNE